MIITKKKKKEEKNQLILNEQQSINIHDCDPTWAQDKIIIILTPQIGGGGEEALGFSHYTTQASCGHS